jgi:hypothetical protein
MYFVQCIRNSRKRKTANPQGGGFSRPAEILFGEFPHHTSSGTFVPDQGHLSSPLPGCQTRLRVIPDVGSDRIGIASARNKIICHSTQSWLLSMHCDDGRRVVHANDKLNSLNEARL